MLRLLVGVLSVLLSGCILDSKKPKAPALYNVQGILVIQDVAGETWNGKVDNALAAAEFRLLREKRRPHQRACYALR